MTENVNAEPDVPYEITVTRSAGTDGAVVVFIDGDFDQTGLRVRVNDEPIYAGPAFEHDGGDNDREAKSVKLTFTLEDIAYEDEPVADGTEPARRPMTRFRVTISTEVEVDLDPRVNGSLPYRFKHLDQVDQPDVEEFLLQLEYAALDKIRDGIRAVEGFEILDDQETP